MNDMVFVCDAQVETPEGTHTCAFEAKTYVGLTVHKSRKHGISGQSGKTRRKTAATEAVLPEAPVLPQPSDSQLLESTFRSFYIDEKLDKSGNVLKDMAHAVESSTPELLYRMRFVFASDLRTCAWALQLLYDEMRAVDIRVLQDKAKKWDQLVSLLPSIPGVHELLTETKEKS